jgi:hypothetical protein
MCVQLCISRVAIKNGKLFVVTAQCRTNDVGTLEEEMRDITRSFHVK